MALAMPADGARGDGDGELSRLGDARERETERRRECEWGSEQGHAAPFFSAHLATSSPAPAHGRHAVATACRGQPLPLGRSVRPLQKLH